MFDKFKDGPAKLVRRIEQIRQMALALWNLRGDGIIKVRRTTEAVHLSIDVNQLAPKLAKSGADATIHSAFCSENAAARAYIDCNQDSTSGESIRVWCSICGGDYLNSAFPRLEAGDRIFVIYDQTAGLWRALQIFQASEEC